MHTNLGNKNMNDKEFKEHHDKCWQQLPLEDKKKLVKYLQDTMDPEFFNDVRGLHAKNPIDWMTPFHMFSGMAMRNHLRGCMKDGELPAVDYGDGESYSNWDDYYVAVIEAAAGVRDIE
jgi:hypothetical protein